jgi:hypothetical protein
MVWRVRTRQAGYVKDPAVTALAATDILQYQILWDGVNGVSPY